MKNKIQISKNHKKEIFRFIIIFLTSILILHFISSLPIFRAKIGTRILLSDAFIIKKTMSVIGVNPVFSIDGIKNGFFSISLNCNSVNVVYDCTSIFSIILLVSAVVAYKSKVNEKIIGLAFCSIILYAINLIRLIMLILIAGYFPKYLDFAHIYFWQVLMIFFVLFLWNLWIERIAGNENKIKIFP